MSATTSALWHHHAPHSTPAPTTLRAWITSRSPAWWINAILVVGVAIRLFRYVMNAPLWGDEAMLMLNLVDRPWHRVIDPLTYGQVAPPLFLATEWSMLRLFGPSEWSLRFFPMLASVASLFVFRKLALLWLAPIPATLALGFLAMASWPIGMTNNIKPYSWDLLGSLTLLLCASLYLKSGQNRWLWMLAALAPIVILGSFPSIFIATAVSLALLVPIWKQRSPGKLLAFAAWNLSVLGSFALCYFYSIARTTAETQEGMRAYWANSFPPKQFLSLVWWLVQAHTGQTFAYPFGSANGGSTLTTLLVAIGLIGWVRERRFVYVVLFAAPFLLGLTASALGRYPYGASGRLAQHVGPLICLAAGAGLGRLLEHPRCARSGFLTACLFFVGVGTASAGVMIYRPHRQSDDVWYRQFFRTLMPLVGPNDVVIYSRDPDDYHLDSTLHWHLAANRSKIAGAARVTEQDLAQSSGNIWIVHYEFVYDYKKYYPPQEFPEVNVLRDRIRAAAPERKRMEQTTYLVPQEFKVSFLRVLHLERWALPGQEPLPRNLPVWP